MARHEIPIRLPGILSGGDPAWEQYSRDVQRAIQQLRDAVVIDRRVPPVAVGGGHPFRITVIDDGATNTIRVASGIVYDQSLHGDSNGDAIIGTTPATIAQTDFVGIADTSDHGIWLECQVTGGANYPAKNQVNPALPVLAIDSMTTKTLIKHATHVTEAGVGALIAASTAKSYLYVGRVILAAGVPTITQSVRRDLFLWHPTYTTDLISDDAGNRLTNGSDGLLFVPPIVVRSTDPGNDISEGSDGGAFYDAP